MPDAAGGRAGRAEWEGGRAEGVHGGMQFTFRNPAGSTDPGRILEGARSLVVGALRTPAPRLAEVGAGRLRIAAYARHDHYATLRGHLERLADRIRSDGWTARVVADVTPLVAQHAPLRARRGSRGPPHPAPRIATIAKRPS